VSKNDPDPLLETDTTVHGFKEPEAEKDEAEKDEAEKDEAEKDEAEKDKAEEDAEEGGKIEVDEV
jgi:hypothetical protein